MLKKICFVITVLLLSNISNYSQSKVMDGFSVSLHSGVFRTSSENFDETYESPFGLVYGLGIGIPISSKSYLYGKATFFSKNGVPLRKTYEFIDGNPVLVSEVKEGSAEFRQWIINGGYQHNFLLGNDFVLGINGGITYTTISEEYKDDAEQIKYSMNGYGMFGFFIGSVLEKSFTNLPFTIFFEPQFNFSRNDIIGITKNYSGFNINIGCRYYLGERKQ